MSKLLPLAVRPLFIPLRRQWFEAFAKGSKGIEWRRYGPRWNERTCLIGRPVTLALGYTRTRLYGKVVSFAIAPAELPGAAEIYGEGTVCALIGIKLIRKR